MKTLLENLQETNTWWATCETEKKFEYEREELAEIINLLNDKRSTIVAGPRQVGKSTMLSQTISYLLANKTKPSNILMFFCDDSNIFNGDTKIADVLSEYERSVLFANLSTVKERIYIFIDEAQAIKDWHTVVKTYIARNENIKFIISGSSAALLFEGANESLYGRHDLLHVYPLRFWQFAKLHSANKNKIVEEVEKKLPKTSLFASPNEYFDELQKVYSLINLHYPQINGLLKMYLTVGGYPEFCFYPTDIDKWQKRLLNDVISSGLYRDIIKVFKIESPKKLEQIFYYIAANSGQPFSYTSIGNTVGLNVETATNYITYLEKAKLIVVQPVHSNNVAKTLRANKKMHILDNGIRNAIMKEKNLDDARCGFAVETALTVYAYAEAEKNLWNVGYQDVDEVDVVLDKKKDVLQIEVKYRNEAKITNKSQPNIVITKTLFKKDGDVFYIPFWLVR